MKPKYQSAQCFSHALSPGVRRLVVEYNVKPEQIKPSGNKNILLKGDVIRYFYFLNLIYVFSPLLDTFKKIN